jgi:hypothetical protein
MAGRSPQDYLKSFNCNQCGAPQQIRGLGLTTTYACTSCGTIIDITDENYRTIAKAMSIRPELNMQLQIGSRCKLREIQFEIIGYMERKDSTGEYCWGEYLLMNPYLGFAWLVDNQQHWTFIEMIKDHPLINGNYANYQNSSYKRFLTDSAKVSFVLGEFYWRIHVGDETSTVDFVAPPYSLSVEMNSDEVVWSRGEYISREELQNAFREKITLERPRNVGMNQPNPWAPALKKIAVPWIFTSLAAITIFGITPHSHQPLLSERFVFTPRSANALSTAAPATAPVVITQPFQIGPRTTNLEISLGAPIENQWLATDLTLVNIASQEAFDGNAEISYYRGIEDGEAWSEGSQMTSTYFSQIPPGTYTITIEPDGSPPEGNVTTTPVYYTIQVVQDIQAWGNMMVVLILISILPIFYIIMYLIFENKRWENSDSAEGSES